MNQKPVRRKTWAFYTVELCLCLPAAIVHGIDWPLAALAGGVYLIYAWAIAAEKILLKFAERSIKSQ